MITARGISDLEIERRALDESTLVSAVSIVASDVELQSVEAEFEGLAQQVADTSRRIGLQ